MAKSCDWPRVNQELLNIARFHVDCAVSLEQDLVKNIKTLPPELVEISRRSIGKHLEWSHILRNMSNIQT